MLANRYTSPPSTLHENAKENINKEVSFRPQPLMPDKGKAAISVGIIPSKINLTTRGFSDSVLPGCIASKGMTLNNETFSRLALQDKPPACGIEMTDQTMPPRMTSRQNLHLPCFNSLGIASRLPDALLTPPEDNALAFEKPALPSYFARSSSFPPLMPKTPSPDIIDFASKLEKRISLTGAPDMTRPVIPAAEAEGEARQYEGSGSMRPSSEGEDLVPGHPTWLVEAVQAVGKYIDHWKGFPVNTKTFQAIC